MLLEARSGVHPTTWLGMVEAATGQDPPGEVTGRAGPASAAGGPQPSRASIVRPFTTAWGRRNWSWTTVSAGTPSRWYTVAARSDGSCGSRVGYAAIVSVAPTQTPPAIPPPA